MFVQIRSRDTDPTDNATLNNALVKAFHEEVYGGVGFYNAISGDPSNFPNLTLHHQSVTFDGQSGVFRPTDWDKKRAQIANRYHTDMVFNGLIDNVFILPGSLESTAPPFSSNGIFLFNPLHAYVDQSGSRTYQSAILDSSGRPYAPTPSIPFGTDMTRALEEAHTARVDMQERRSLPPLRTSMNELKAIRKEDADSTQPDNSSNLYFRLKQAS